MKQVKLGYDNQGGLRTMFNTAKKELLKYNTSIIGKEIDDLMSEVDNYNVFIGMYHHDGFMSDYSLNDNSNKALMDFDGAYLIDYLIDYYNNLSQNLTVAIMITYYDSFGDYIEYSLEYNGYELFGDERY